MRNFTLLMYALFCVFSASAQIDNSSNDSKDSISSYIVTLLEDIDKRIFRIEMQNRYKLYPTDNIYNFLKLDTRTGRIEQVQWSLDTNKEVTVTINNDNLSWSSDSLFELYPTQNIYQFLLLDKSSGRTWHVQWGMENNKRWIRRIY